MSPKMDGSLIEKLQDAQKAYREAGLNEPTYSELLEAAWKKAERTKSRPTKVLQMPTERERLERSLAGWFLGPARSPAEELLQEEVGRVTNVKWPSGQQ